MGEVNTTHYQIFEYWQDKRLSDYTGNEQDYESVVDDWGEPMCWACGKRAIEGDALEHLLESAETEDDYDYKRIWNNGSVRKKLQRCHIIPAALGGADEPSNLFLLCTNCHYFSPDTTNAKSFFRWVAKRRKMGVYYRARLDWLEPRLNAEFEERGVPSLRVIVETIGDVGDPEEFRAFVKKNMGTHASSLVDSTFISGIADYLEEKWREKTGASV